MQLAKNIEHLFPGYTKDLEGEFLSIYSDTKRLLTTSAGVLIDPLPRCLALEWWLGDRRATEQEIVNDWNAIKSRALKMTDEDLKKWTAKMQAPLTSVRLKDDYNEQLIINRLRANYTYVVTHLLPDLPSAPADAILGTMSLAWGVGAGFDKTTPPRTAFIEAARSGDWLAAGAAARMREDNNKGVVPRNRHQDLMFANAATVARRGLDPAALWWPNKCPTEDSLKTLAIKALDLGLAKASLPPEKE